MAHQRIYKNIGIEDEATWGASVTGNARYLQVTSVSLNKNPNKELVQDTQTSIKGRDRMTIGRNEIDGDISSYASPKILHNFFEMVNGTDNTGASVGASALIYTYQQNTSGTYLSKTVTLDRNNTQEKFSGIRATRMTLSGSDSLIEASITTMGKAFATGVSLADAVGETVKPFEFADINVSIGGPSYANPVTVNVSSWSLEYNNGMERSFLSGSRDASRLDGGIPELTGTIELFHEGTSWVSPTYGVTELYIRIDASTTSAHGLIAGVTPHYLRVDVPRVQFTTHERNYEQNALAKETINFTAMFDPGLSCLWRPQLTTGYGVES